MSSAALLVKKQWNSLAIHCTYCCHPVAYSSVSSREKIVWCPSCHQVFKMPMLKAPSWITGVLTVLLLNLH